MLNKRALIIEDDHASRSIWDLVLHDRGYEVLSASDMASASEQVSDNVSLYLVDYYLPDGRGSALVSHIRQHAPASVIIVTSMDDAADVIRESMLAGSNVFIVKPSGMSIIGELLEEIDSGQVDASIRQLINRNGRRTYTGL